MTSNGIFVKTLVQTFTPDGVFAQTVLQQPTSDGVRTQILTLTSNDVFIRSFFQKLLSKEYLNTTIRESGFSNMWIAYMFVLYVSGSGVRCW